MMVHFLQYKVIQLIIIHAKSTKLSALKTTIKSGDQAISLFTMMVIKKKHEENFINKK